jgi:hypothetical protein
LGVRGFSGSAAHEWAEREHLLEKAGQRMPAEDGYLAATTQRHGLTMVTGNVKDFYRPSLKVFKPVQGVGAYGVAAARERERDDPKA